MRFYFVCCFLVAFATAMPLDNNIIKQDGDSTIEPLIKARIDDLHEMEKAERLNKGFEKLLKIVDIMSHLDHYVVDKTRAVIKKLATIADDDIGYTKQKNDNTIE